MLTVGPTPFVVISLRSVGLRFLFKGNETSIDLAGVFDARIDVLICISACRHPTFLPAFSGYPVWSSQQANPLATWRILWLIRDANPLGEFYLHSMSLRQRLSAESLLNDCHRFISQPDQNWEKYWSPTMSDPACRV